MTARMLAFVTWAMVAASAVFWLLKLGPGGVRTPAHAAIAAGDVLPAAGGDLTRLFGAAPVAAAPMAQTAAPAPTDNRFKLLGVVAGRGTRPSEGLALISVDGKPPRAYGLGAVVEEDTVLLHVDHRRAELGPRGGPARVTLELPPLAMAARTALPAPTGISPMAAMPAVRPMPMPPPESQAIGVTPANEPNSMRSMQDAQGVSAVR